MKKAKVLIGSPVRQRPDILGYFLESLANLEKNTVEVDYCFVDDNVDEKSAGMLREFKDEGSKVLIIGNEEIEEKYKCDDEYICDAITHRWTVKLTYKVGAFKDTIIEYAKNNEYDYLFLIDSDIVLYPQTLEHLVSTNKDIISEIHWTQYTEEYEAPNVWLYDQTDFAARERGEELTPADKWVREREFFRKLKVPGIYPIGGLCACTLVSKNAIQQGVRFKEMYNLTFLGEDRHFCIRASALGMQLYVDTHYPGYHIYMEKDLDGVEDFKKISLKV